MWCAVNVAFASLLKSTWQIIRQIPQIVLSKIDSQTTMVWTHNFRDKNITSESTQQNIITRKEQWDHLQLAPLHRSTSFNITIKNWCYVTTLEKIRVCQWGCWEIWIPDSFWKKQIHVPNHPSYQEYIPLPWYILRIRWIPSGKQTWQWKIHYEWRFSLENHLFLRSIFQPHVWLPEGIQQPAMYSFPNLL